MFLVLFPLKQNKTIWITTYLQKFAPSYSLKSRIKNFFYEQGIKRVHKIVTANRNLQFDAEKTVYIPGYFYDPKIYSRYQTTKKIIRVLCIGTMHETKDLEGIVEIFKKVNIPLLIVGKFHDEKRLHDLLGRAPDNVTIIDKYTTFDEYYKFISESKYVILPYKQEFYSRRTSGVLIETIFLGSIPIAPAFLLNFNNISGIAYNDMHELIDIINSGNNSSLTSCIEDYRVDSIKDRIINMVNTYR
jgi:glycosyltransferase involved in cell wall biosynthesis